MLRAILLSCVLLTFLRLSDALVLSDWKPEQVPQTKRQLPPATLPLPPSTKMQPISRTTPQPPGTRRIVALRRRPSGELGAKSVEGTKLVSHDCNLGTSYPGWKGQRPNCFWKECGNYCWRIGCRGRKCRHFRYVFYANFNLGTKKRKRHAFWHTCRSVCQYT